MEGRQKKRGAKDLGQGTEPAKGKQTANWAEGAHSTFLALVQASTTTSPVDGHRRLSGLHASTCPLGILSVFEPVQIRWDFLLKPAPQLLPVPDMEAPSHSQGPPNLALPTSQSSDSVPPPLPPVLSLLRSPQSSFHHRTFVLTVTSSWNTPVSIVHLAGSFSSWFPSTGHLLREFFTDPSTS